jgi:glycine C-acetyltransferase/8-amino-7-oxononanoate synthase
MSSMVGPRVLFDGREFDYFCGSGYLGLQTHPLVLQAAHTALERYGLSTATSRGGFGEHPVYDELEREACAFFDAQKTLHLPSGYLGISVLAQASGQLFEHIFIDNAAHFSLWDAAHLTNLAITPFSHLRPDALAEALRAELRPNERPLVLSDGVFPISGEIAPLPQYLQIISAYDGLMYIDDAHAAGVLGPNGRGSLDYYAIAPGVCRVSATLAKALGGFGGVLWGEAGWIEQIERNSRICVGASPPPLVTALASAQALSLVRSQPELREQLWQNVANLKNGLRGLGWPLAETPVPIICLRGERGISLERIRSGLYQHGIAVELVRSYTSAPAGGGLRIAVFAQHSSEQIERLVAEIRALC